MQRMSQLLFRLITFRQVVVLDSNLTVRFYCVAIHNFKINIMEVLQNIQRQMEADVAEIKRIESGKCSTLLSN